MLLRISLIVAIIAGLGCGVFFGHGGGLAYPWYVLSYMLVVIVVAYAGTPATDTNAARSSAALQLIVLPPGLPRRGMWLAEGRCVAPEFCKFLVGSPSCHKPLRRAT